MHLILYRNQVKSYEGKLSVHIRSQVNSHLRDLRLRLLHKLRNTQKLKGQVRFQSHLFGFFTFPLLIDYYDIASSMDA